MTAIGDSSAVRIAGRVLPQHQAALTLLQQRLSTPGIETFAWLDLACGRGQILGGLRDSLSGSAREKVDFCAYDINQDYVRETSRTASNLEFAQVTEYVGDLANFDRLLPPTAHYDFITLTNTVHEVAADRLANVLVDTIRRLDEQGTAYIYDMERLDFGSS